MPIYDSIDLSWTWDGDYILGQDGDLKGSDEGGDLLESLLTEIHTVLRSEFDDWQHDPNVGANLSDFRGEPNSRETADLIKQRIKGRLAAARILQSEDIVVQTIPTGRHELLIVISLNVTSTPENNLEPGEPLVVTLVYDTLEDSVFFLDESQASRQARSY
jgi:hypothetical protein